MAAPFVQPNEQDDSSTASQPLRATIDNPFITEERVDHGDNRLGDSTQEPPAIIPLPPPTANNPGPPAYSEAIRRPIINNSSRSPLEVTPLLSRESSITTLPGSQTQTARNHVRQQRGIARALLLWLGIGQWYSGVCIFISFIFFSGGVIVVILSVITLDFLLDVKLTTVAAGALFILLSVLWPCAWLWNQWNMTCGCSYSPLVAYTWILSIAYAMIVGALTYGVNDNYKCIHFCDDCPWNNSTSNGEEDVHYPCEFVQVSLWVLVAMVALALVFVFLSCCYCFCNGISCRKEPRSRRYTRL